jgi:hypothetical protein
MLITLNLMVTLLKLNNMKIFANLIGKWLLKWHPNSKKFELSKLTDQLMSEILPTDERYINTSLFKASS